MTLILDSQTEHAIQREIDLGHARDAGEVIAQAVAMLQRQRDWFKHEEDAINARLDASFDQAQRGETVDGETAMQEMEAQLLQSDRSAAA